MQVQTLIEWNIIDHSLAEKIIPAVVWIRKDIKG